MKAAASAPTITNLMPASIERGNWLRQADMRNSVTVTSSRPTKSVTKSLTEASSDMPMVVKTSSAGNSARPAGRRAS